MNKRLAILVLLCLLLAASATAYGKKEEKAAPSGKPLVVASFFPLYDFARTVGGADFQAVCLVPPGPIRTKSRPRPMPRVTWPMPISSCF